MCKTKLELCQVSLHSYHSGFFKYLSVYIHSNNMRDDAYILPHFDKLMHVVICPSSAMITLAFAEVW